MEFINKMAFQFWMCKGLYEVHVVIIFVRFPYYKGKKIFYPNSNISLLKVLKFVVSSPLSFLQASGCIFITSVIRYVTFVPKPEVDVKQPII